MRKIILDVDTGTDDATAIIAAALSDEIELMALTTVWGNREVDITTKHTLMVTELLNMDIPVYRGCSRPMVRFLYDDREPKLADLPPAVDEQGEVAYHGDFDLPEPKRTPEKQHAVSYIIETLRNTTEKITLVAVGPLTNVGMALSMAPDIVENIEEIVVMGGGVAQANVTTCAEANIYHDPEAAQIIAECGVRTVWVTLDATHKAALPKEYIQMCRDLKTPIGDFFATMLVERIRVYNVLQPIWAPDLAPIHDAMCIAYLIDPTVFDDLRNVHLDICLERGAGCGAFLIDWRHYHLPANAWVTWSGDQKKFGDIMMDILRKHASKA